MDGSKKPENWDAATPEDESLLDHFKSEAVAGNTIIGGGAEPFLGKEPGTEDATSIEGGNGNGNGNGNGTGTALE